MKWFARFCLFVFATLFCSMNLNAQSKRKVIIDQGAAGPGGTDMQAILALVNSPDTDVLGVTVVTGDAWRDEEVQHALRGRYLGLAAHRTVSELQNRFSPTNLSHGRFDSISYSRQLTINPSEIFTITKPCVCTS